MKTRKTYLVIALAIFTGNYLFSQKEINARIFESLPQNLTLKNEVQEYVIIADHYNGDIFGNLFNKMRVKGNYTRGLDAGKAKWNSVSVAFAMPNDSNFPEGQKLEYMENFTYTPDAGMMNPDKFTTFSEHAAFAKNLVWDMLGIEGLAWAHFEKLQLNKPFMANDFNQKIDLAGQGFFENKHMIITWTGISKQHGELCAIIEYRTLNNPLSLSFDGMEIKGLSNYWGNIWVSLEDKQIEYATMFENVTMEILFPGQTHKQLTNTIREIELIKIQNFN